MLVQETLSSRFISFRLGKLETKREVRRFLEIWNQVIEQNVLRQKMHDHDQDLVFSEFVTEKVAETVNEILTVWEASPALRQITRVPLLLRWLLVLYRQQGKLPRTRIELYEAIAELLLRDHPRHKGMQLLIDMGRLEPLLSRMGHYMLEKTSRGRILKSDLLRILEEELDHPRYQDFVKATNLLEDFVEVARYQTGIIVEQSPNAYEFAHRGFAEYYAARWLNRSISKAPERIRLHLDNPLWREVSIMAVCHYGRNSEDEEIEDLVQYILARNSYIETILHRNHLFIAHCIAEGLPSKARPIVQYLLQILADPFGKGRFNGLQNQIVEVLDNIHKKSVVDQRILEEEIASVISSIKDAKEMVYFLELLEQRLSIASTFTINAVIGSNSALVARHSRPLLYRMMEKVEETDDFPNWSKYLQNEGLLITFGLLWIWGWYQENLENYRLDWRYTLKSNLQLNNYTIGEIETQSTIFRHAIAVSAAQQFIDMLNSEYSANLPTNADYLHHLLPKAQVIYINSANNSRLENISKILCTKYSTSLFDFLRKVTVEDQESLRHNQVPSAKLIGETIVKSAQGCITLAHGFAEALQSTQVLDSSYSYENLADTVAKVEDKVNQLLLKSLQSHNVIQRYEAMIFLLSSNLDGHEKAAEYIFSELKSPDNNRQRAILDAIATNKEGFSSFPDLYPAVLQFVRGSYD